MKIARCHAGHFYDSEKYKECPFCRQEPQTKNPAVRTDMSSYTRWEDAARAADENRTVMDPESEGLLTHMYVTGWLVCVEGPEQGRDYRLRYGFNQIGRSHRMDVCIFEDDGITRGVHCSVVYEKRKNQFLLVPGQGTLTWMDGVLVDKPVELFTGDRFKIGETVLEFIAFCRDDVKWEK